ncbi:MAG TPA: DnaJ domain-containing protein [Acetobacteraceae bacterium]
MVLLIYQQWAPAMMLGAGVLIVLTLVNWRGILARMSYPAAGNRAPDDDRQPRPDAELAHRAAIVLEDYLAHVEARPPRIVARQQRLSAEEALDVLGLAQGASASAIRAAHRRLMQLVHPDRGGTTYLAARINEAKDVLMAQAVARKPRRVAARQRGDTADE